MRRILPVLLLAALALWTGCGEDRGMVPGDAVVTPGETRTRPDPEALAGEIAGLSGWQAEEGAMKMALPGCVTLDEKTPLAGGVVHYTYTLRFGPGEYDLIGLHRVVKEERAGKPVRTRKNVFLLHGDGEAFEAMFLPGANVPSLADDYGIAVYLARNDVDVWGIDQSWALVPQGVTDFTFMADWDLQHEVDNLAMGIAVARAARVLTACGTGRMLLLAYSSGAITGYACLNQETQYPELMRNICGFIPVDMPFKTDDPVVEGTLAAFAANFQGMIDGGIYKYDSLFGPVGMLAQMDPDGASPLVPGYTNIQVAVFLGAATHVFTPLNPHFHYLAGDFDEDGNLQGFGFVQTGAWFEFLQNSAPYEALPFMAEYAAIIGDAADLPYDDHLAEITVPVFYVGAAGGMGTYGEYTLTLLGSTDVSSLVVRLLPAGYEAADYGHIDLFLANNAEALVWSPMLGWIETHTDLPGKSEKRMAKGD